LNPVFFLPKKGELWIGRIRAAKIPVPGWQYCTANRAMEYLQHMQPKNKVGARSFLHPSTISNTRWSVINGAAMGKGVCTRRTNTQTQLSGQHGDCATQLAHLFACSSVLRQMLVPFYHAWCISAFYLVLMIFWAPSNNFCSCDFNSRLPGQSP